MIHSVVVGSFRSISKDCYMLKKVLLVLPLIFWTSFALAEVPVDTAWVRTYSSSGNATDKGFDIVVDARGRVYVTGLTQVEFG